MNDKETSISEVKAFVQKWIDERDWDQFHPPKEISSALAIEVSELMEHFRFKTHEEVEEYLKDPKHKEEVEDEAADIFFFLIDFARRCNIDLAKAFEHKMKKAAKKYPADLVKGKNHKYTYYQENKND